MGLAILLVQCGAMFGASLLVGSLPLMFRSASSGKQLKAVSVLGMGILVGAALTIIIPEGVSTLYASLPTGNTEHQEDTVRAIGLSLLAGFFLMLLIEVLTPHPPESHGTSPSSSPSSPSTPLNASTHEEGRPDLHHLNSRSPIMPKRMHVHDNASGDKACATSGALRGLNATLGMVIHGAADGIALGASSLSENQNLGLIVFIAVLVHKGPTALGLTTTLLSLGLDHAGIRKRLMIFSCAAPLGAILTFMLVQLFGGNSAGFGHGHSRGKNDVEGLQWWTGIALLFSGGSFLYVATVIQPLSSTNPEEHEHDHASPDPSHESQLGKYARISLLAGGMVLPVLLSALVGDHH